MAQMTRDQVQRIADVIYRNKRKFKEGGQEDVTYALAMELSDVNDNFDTAKFVSACLDDRP